ncbi:uncharacterized protein KY384_007525 [Bacidia gigantensis]|uniref:uncharacterized protein n=1 Tax=Bacidia gigantensis TaxID=2732470 RepID=UPI001D048524|nr:uncharacterized protein KY384_007525 [Bacidia gigantensis]KAG8527373.1 hypothetical protein KY384_007525 [Bacidia gigantensis]
MSNTVEGRLDYFFVNYDLDNLRVNNAPFPRMTIIGPMADFAVIEIGEAVMFWWRTKAAMNYRPSRAVSCSELCSFHLSDERIQIARRAANDTGVPPYEDGRDYQARLTTCEEILRNCDLAVQAQFLVVHEDTLLVARDRGVEKVEVEGEVDRGNAQHQAG